MYSWSFPLWVSAVRWRPNTMGLDAFNWEVVLLLLLTVFPHCKTAHTSLSESPRNVCVCIIHVLNTYHRYILAQWSKVGVGNVRWSCTYSSGISWAYWVSVINIGFICSLSWAWTDLGIQQLILSISPLLFLQDSSRENVHSMWRVLVWCVAAQHTSTHSTPSAGALTMFRKLPLHVSS